jgi:hypothetical protein
VFCEVLSDCQSRFGLENEQRQCLCVVNIEIFINCLEDLPETLVSQPAVIVEIHDLREGIIFAPLYFHFHQFGLSPSDLTHGRPRTLCLYILQDPSDLNER